MRSYQTAKKLAATRNTVFSNEQIEYLSPGDLIPYPGNARTHNAEQIEQLKASLTTFGFVNPGLIDKDNVILAGHGRTIAAIELGFERIPVLRIEEPGIVRLTILSVFYYLGPDRTAGKS